MGPTKTFVRGRRVQATHISKQSLPIPETLSLLFSGNDLTPNICRKTQSSFAEDHGKTMALVSNGMTVRQPAEQRQTTVYRLGTVR
jgi:hypothetical protein